MEENILTYVFFGSVFITLLVWCIYLIFKNQNLEIDLEFYKKYVENLNAINKLNENLLKTNKLYVKKFETLYKEANELNINAHELLSKYQEFFKRYKKQFENEYE